MSVLPLGNSNVSDVMQTQLMTNSVNSQQAQLLQVENELTTGYQINQPSDNPSATSTILQLQQTLDRRQSYADNINSATAQLSQTDSSLTSLSTLLEQAQQIASADVGSDVTQSQRQSDSTVVQSILQQALAIGNQNFDGQYLFGGASASTQPFISTDGNVQYVGSTQTLENNFDDGITLSFQANGAQIFGSMSSGVTGSTTIGPALSAQTLLSSVGGAGGSGVALGAIQISDGTTSKIVDLSSASTVGDVVNAINSAGVGDITASISGQGITLSGGGSDNISVTDLGGGTTAADLGIVTAGSGTSDVGSSLQPKVTVLTSLSDLNDGTGLDNSGLFISNGGTTKTITWSAGGTVQDLLNAINGAGLGVSAQINSAGTGINVMNATQGTSLSIGENGGTSAAELGLQTLTAATPLSQLNNGSGVSLAGGTTPDIQMTTASGTTFQVTLSGATTVGDVLNDINTASGGAVTASLATTGSGIVLTDNTTGSGSFSISEVNDSGAVKGLGLTTSASGNTMTGTDVGAPKSGGIFGNLQSLISSLQSGDIAGINSAAQGLSTDTSRVTESQGQVGAIEQELTNRNTQLSSENTATQSLLGNIRDTNMADAISQFQTLQTSLQAGLETDANSQYMSLFDYLS